MIATTAITTIPPIAASAFFHSLSASAGATASAPVPPSVSLLAGSGCAVVSAITLTIPPMIEAITTMTIPAIGVKIGGSDDPGSVRNSVTFSGSCVAATAAAGVATSTCVAAGTAVKAGADVDVDVDEGVGVGAEATGGEFTEEITGRVMQGMKEFLSLGGGGGAGMFSPTEWIMEGVVWSVLLLFVGLGYWGEGRSYGRASRGSQQPY